MSDATPRRVEAGSQEAGANLSMDPAQFRRLGHALVDDIATALADIPRGPVTRDLSPSQVRKALDLLGPLPEQGTEPGELLKETTHLLFSHSLFNGHPRFFGYVTAPPSPIGILGEFLAAAVNPNVGAWTLSPAATEIESQTVRWLASFISYPDDCGGVLVSGGNMANIVGFLAARADKTPWDVRAHGTADPDRRTLRVYASTETHTWIHKATDMCGLGTDAIRWIPTDPTLRMDVGALQRQIDSDRAAGDIPLLVVGTAGSVSTGAVDPLEAIAAICRDRDVWFHVDGAYGGFAAALPDASDDLRALALADSVAVDPHKWLYAPLEAGCVLVRRGDALRRAFAYHPPYYHFGEHATNYVDYGPQNSRGFRALKVWLALKQAGASGYRAMIGENIRLSAVMAKSIDAHPELELVSHGLSIVTFRYVPSNLRPGVGSPDTERVLDGLNRALLDQLQRGGEVFVSNAVVHGRYVLRACIVNFHTTETDVEALPGIVAARGRSIAATLQTQEPAHSFTDTRRVALTKE